MTDLPNGTVTFLFTDIEGSTALWERDQTAMAAAVERHLALLRSAIEAHYGVLYKTVGDAVQAAFPTAISAVAAALVAQRATVAEPWPVETGPLRVRMALHTTAAQPRDGDYLAPGLNRLARLLAAAHGGQVLLSFATRELVRDDLPAGASLNDLGEHPLRDLHRPERVFQLLHPELAAEFPAIRTLSTQRHNLPLQLTPFLGRETQVAEVVGTLRLPEARLLTVTGPGGVGKTRLALQAGADLLEVFPDGVWFVDLSTTSNAAQVLPVIAAVLGVRGEGSDLEGQIVVATAGKRLLLILDNCERVLDAAPWIVSLNSRVPGLKVLATSRIPLHAYGEREYPLSPLPRPDPAATYTPEQLTQYEAVRLFIARSQAVRPEFAVTHDNAPAVAEICSRLDGLPLAIELAAALVKVLPPLALLKRLDRRLPMLTGGARTLPTRQQTMRNAIAWSVDLLGADAQTVFRRLSVFLSGCTFEAADAVANSEESIDVFAALATLIDQSLLRQEDGITGEPRYRMLETVREYGSEQLEASGEGVPTRDRFAAWCLTFAEHVQTEGLFNLDQIERLNLIDAELPNLRAAIAQLSAAGNAGSVLRLVAATHEYWAAKSYHVDVSEWLAAALAAATDAPGGDRASAHDFLVMAYATMGKHQQAVAQAELAWSEADATGDSHSMGWARYDLGLAWEFSGDGKRAAAAYSEALALMRTSGDEAFAVWILGELGDKLVWLGEIDRGKAMLEEALDFHRHAGNAWEIATTLGQLGHADRLLGHLAASARSFVGSINAAQSIGDMRIRLGAIAGIAGVALAGGDSARAVRLLGAVDAVSQRHGIRRIAHALHVERIVAAAHEAAPDFENARVATPAREITLEQVIAEALAIAAEIGAATPNDASLSKPSVAAAAVGASEAAYQRSS